MARTPKTITQRIALDGGEEIRKELEALGKAGEEAFRKLKEAVSAADAPSNKLAASLADLRANFDQLRLAGTRLIGDFRNLGQAWNQLETAAVRLARNILAIAAAAAAAAVGLFKLVQSGLESADAIGKAAEKFGIGVEQFQKLDIAAKQAELSSEQLGNALSILNDALGDTGEDGNKARKAIQDLGISLKNADGTLKTADQLLLDIADAFQRMPDGVRKSASAIDIFTRRLGPALIPLLNEGREGILSWGEAWERAGLLATEAQTKVADNALDAFSFLTETLKKLKEQLALVFAADFQRGAEEFTALLVNNADAIKAFVADLRERVIPVVEDFFNLLTGRDTIRAENRFLLEWRKSLLEFKDALVTVATAVKAVLDTIIAAAAPVAKAINAVFGTEFTGATLLATAAVLKFLGVFRLLGALVRFAGASFTTLIGTFRFIGELVLLVGSAFTKLIQVLLVVGRYLLGAAAAAGRFVASFGTIGEIVGGAIRVFGRFAVAAAAFVAAVVGWPALIVAAIAAALTAIVVFWDEIVAGAEAAWDAVKSAASDAIDFVKALFSGDFAGAWDIIAERAAAAWNLVKAGALALARALDEILFFGQIGDNWDAIVRFADQAWQAIRAGAQALWNFLDGLFGGTLSAGWDLLVGAADEAWQAIRAGAQAAYDFLVELFGQPINAAWESLVAGAETAWQALQDGAAAAWNAVAEAAAAIDFSALLQAVQDAVAKIPDFFSAAWERIKGIFDFGGLFGGLITAASTALTELGGLFRTAFEELKSFFDFSGLFGGADTALPTTPAGLQQLKTDADAAKAATDALATSLQNLSALTGIIETVKQAFVDLGLAITQAFASLAGPVAEEGEEGEGGAVVGGPFAGLVTSAEQARAAILQIFTSLRSEIDQALRGGGQAAEEQDGGGGGLGGEGEQQSSGGEFQSFVDAALAAKEQIVGIFAELGQAIVAALSQSLSASAFESLVAGASDAANAVVSAFDGLAGEVENTFNGVVSAIQGAFDALAAAVESLISRLEAELARLAAAIRNAKAEAGGGGGGGFAGGGQVFGAGTETSDSIPAWLSKNEFVIRAAAVKRYGVALFSALNGLRLPKNFLKGFSGGGIADSLGRSFDALSVPRMKMGGLVPNVGLAAGGGRSVNVNLSLGGSEPLRLMTDEETAGQLTRFALRHQARRAGNSPSWA